MQAERVQIASKQLLAKGCASSWFVPLEVDASVDDVLKIFAQFLLDRQRVDYPQLQNCFEVLLQSVEDCMFVFMRRGTNEAVGILRSRKPLCTEREQTLLRQIGQETAWELSAISINTHTHHPAENFDVCLAMTKGVQQDPGKLST